MMGSFEIIIYCITDRQLHLFDIPMNSEKTMGVLYNTFSELLYSALRVTVRLKPMKK